MRKIFDFILNTITNILIVVIIIFIILISIPIMILLLAFGILESICGGLKTGIRKFWLWILEKCEKSFNSKE